MHNIKRRDFLKTMGLGCAAIGLSGFDLSIGKLQKHQKPNILFIMADDLGKEWIVHHHRFIFILFHKIDKKICEYILTKLPFIGFATFSGV